MINSVVEKILNEKEYKQIIQKIEIMRDIISNDQNEKDKKIHEEQLLQLKKAVEEYQENIKNSFSAFENIEDPCDRENLKKKNVDEIETKTTKEELK